ncbi:MAG: hydrogenase formation protein HypD [Desulfotomaculaceae bacterium]|nr:hydrogenase formation protein HypD [Desulfotomaculaceae bacterium]
MHEVELVQLLISEIKKCGQPFAFMEVCGTHTMAISRYGLRQVLPDNIKLLSGPGCPVCVTANRDIDTAITFAKIPGLILTTFGDMIRVPGSKSSLAGERAEGRDIRVIYSVLEALEIAKQNPSREVVFYAVGFETTAPSTAFGIMEASKAGLKNFSVICMHKTLPNALRALLDTGDLGINGFLLPGHVSAIIGAKGYAFLAKAYGIGGAITGFEPIDILGSILKLIRQQTAGPVIENEYRRVVKDNGNQAALMGMQQVLTACNSDWRGLGTIPCSGLAIKADWQEYDALRRFEIELDEPVEHKGCSCGDILRGIKLPAACPMFGVACTPENPIGPCMVSSEGSCAAHYRYREQ